jgi:hypothetical protein
MRRRERLRLGSEEKINDNESNDHQYDEYAQPRGEDRGSNENRDTRTGTTKNIHAYAAMYGDSRTKDSGGSDTSRLSESEQQARRDEVEAKEADESYRRAKQVWKEANPDDTLKRQKERYILGKIDKLPWEHDE